ncbi:hypothetical protein [Mesorhizobium sp. ES1-4]|uniref:hypothetical protein n=1 Tax=Mesorhizobium sp. ES1-4 TaxID=2876627 RepID=UPI001CD03739|nr:hypothetical protein [Mesorhizobium sp. ES1-4]MBZ9797655.1 hypothetical protein [Mesorhizobium sp. ES1-4]
MSRFEALLDAARGWARPFVTTSTVPSLASGRRRSASLLTARSDAQAVTAPPAKDRSAHVHPV